jgi:UDP-N-acetyl-2-amino-2-deoxyglucuronate dehydrogenase
LTARSKVRVGVCGLGGMGQAYCLALKGLENAELAAVCTRRPNIARKFGAEFHAHAYDQLSDMVKNKKLDAVLVATPNYLHSQQTVIALEAGKHVLCTKPMATNLIEAERMIAQAHRSGRVLEIGFQYRYDPRIYRAKQMIDAAQLGNIFFGVDYLSIYRSKEYWEEGPWRGSMSQAGGGLLPTHASHDLDYLQWFLGPVNWVAGRTDTLVHRVEVEDTVSATLKFKSGAIVSLAGTLAARASKTPRFEIFGEQGALSLIRGRSEGRRPSALLFSDGKSWRRIAGKDNVSSRLHWSDIPSWVTGMSCVPSANALVRNLKEFLSSIVDQKDPLVPGEEGRKSLEITEGIYRSTKEGRIERFPLRR